MQKNVGRFSIVSSAESRTACGIGLPSGKDGRGRENRNRCPDAGKRARSDRHTGRLIRFREREGKALGVPANQRSGGDSLPSPRSGKKTVLSHGATQTGGVAASRAKDEGVAPQAQPRRPQRARDRRPFGKERGESASGSARKRRALRSAQRGIERVPNPPARSFFRPPFPLTPAIVTDRPRRHRRLGGAGGLAKPAE